jgi:membrane fusion protein (multidrug efflux system)
MRLTALYEKRKTGNIMRLILFVLGLAAGCLATVAVFLVIPAIPPSQMQAAPNDSRVVAAVPVKVVEVVPQYLEDILTLPAQTQAWQDITLSALAGGQMEWVGVDKGDAVEEGQLIARIDVKILEASLTRAQAALDLARSQYERRKQLFDRNVVSKEELDRSATELALAQGALKEAQIALDNGLVRSPVKGVINARFADQGEFVDRGMPLFHIVDTNRIKVFVDVPELDVRFMSIGQTATITADALPGRAYTGVVNFVSFAADPATRAFSVRMETANPEAALRPGMIVRASLLRRAIEDAIAVPLFALVDKAGERLVFVEEDGIARARTVEIGLIKRDRVQILSGLEPGDHLIVAGQTLVEEGTPLEIR